MYAIPRHPGAPARAAAPPRRLDAAALPALATLLAALLAAVAAGVHATVTDESLTAWWGYGVFFFALTLAQAGYALLVLSERRPAVFAVGAVGNLALVALYVVTRAVAVPVGPWGGAAAAVGRPDALATLAEGGAVLVLLLLLGHARAMAPARSRTDG